VDFSADGKRLLSAGWDCTVRVTDTATGALLKTYETPRPVFDAVWAGESIVWTSRTGLGLGLAQPGGDVESIQAKEWTRLVARPNSSEVACCGDRYVPGVRIFDVETRKFTGWDPDEAFERACWDVAYTHDGRKLALGWTDACVVVDADTGKTLQRFPLKGYGFAVAYSPDDRWLAVVEGSDILILDARTGDIANRLEGHAGEVFSLAWNPDGTRLASGGRDRVIRIWDPRTGARLLDLRGHTDYVKDLDWSPDGKTLASASGDNTARLWRSE
jgi:WD40 repeat protein